MAGALSFSRHAIVQMFARGISVEDVASVLSVGRVIEDYPDDHPYPSKLVLAQIEGRFLHVVAAFSPAAVVVITAYEPDPALWDESRTVRRK